ncbi:fatty acid desaturase family protein [Nocardioides mesophilus]|uniref:Acyl-CoA desaturase n=1 Tax=Nocardioides mesophilus TaxID=433659 RepID=A0A7G9R7X0_9ACTN|nr:acyl-CoA desaturase [Nocardioides mesophilus]QNN51695.1 acyl-CoA desaturase [Nocardioides mesophilus]
MTALQKKPGSQVAHLTAADIETLGRELDAIRQSVIDSRGERDAAYIRRVIDVQRKLELSGRVILLASKLPPAWFLGTACLAAAKILDNMEIGHNVLHGQWDWMRDPKIHSTTWDWDHASPPEQWKRAHNVTHHTYTNILGKDNDLGYGIMRVDEDQPWTPRYLVQPLWNFINACIFEYGIAMYDLDLGEHLRDKRKLSPEMRGRLKQTLTKVRKQVVKDYVAHPVLSGPSWRSTLTANLTANLVRNVWSHSVIMCGHFPEGVETFEQNALDENETKGEWYLRQMLGSANISGSKAMHLMSGNLSHQIEHHLFPDLPSNRYREIAPRIQALFERYGLTYHAAPFPKQVASAWHKVLRLSLPNGWLEETTLSNAPRQVRKLFRKRAPQPVEAQASFRPAALIAASM